jgi:hypothetical protein
MAKLGLYLHTYIIFFHPGISKSFIMLLFELMKPHNFTKHCYNITDEPEEGGRICFLCEFALYDSG